MRIRKWAKILAVALAIGPGTTWGQVPAPPVLPGRVALGAPNGVVEPTFDLKFPGGTVVEFVQMVGDARGRSLNVLIDEADRSIRIPPVEMTGITAGSLLQAINRLGVSRQQSFMFDAGNYSTTGEVVWSLVTDRSGKPSIEQVKFFNLEPYLTKNTVEDITTALNAGYQLKTGSTERLNLKFHKETQLLMVRGGPEELSMVADVLSQLKPSTPAKAPAAQTKPAEAAPKSSGQ